MPSCDNPSLPHPPHRTPIRQKRKQSVREVECFAPDHREVVGPLSADKVCMGTLGYEQRWLGRGPEEERMLGARGLQEKVLVG